MRKFLNFSLLGAILLLGVTSAQTQATDSAVDRIAQLEAQLASMESRLQDFQDTDTYANSYVSASCCGSPGITGGYDFLALSPHFSNGISYQTRVIVASDSVVNTHGYPTDYNMAPRFWLGYQGDNGMGMRLRYSQYDQQLTNQTIDSIDATRTIFFDGLSATNGQIMSFGTGMELHVLDVDVTKDFEAWHGQLTVGAGVRYADLQYGYAARVTDNIGGLQFLSNGENTFEGTGPSAFVDFNTPIRQSRLSVIGGLRGSVLFGRGTDIDVVQRVIAPAALNASIERANRSTGVVDASLGLQYDRGITGGVDGFIRCTWEGQLWMDVGSPVQSGGDMSMQGLCIGAGITR